MQRLGDLVSVDRRSVQPETIAEGQAYLGLEQIETGGRIASVASVRAGELRSAKFAFDERHVLFGKLRPNLAKVARPDFVGICSTDIVPLLPGPRVDRDYLAHFLLAPSTVLWATSRAVGVNLPRISPSVLETLDFPLPPLPEQRRIASILDEADGMRSLRKLAMDALPQTRMAALEIVQRGSTTELRLGDVLLEIQSGTSPVADTVPASNGQWGVLKLGAVSGGVYRGSENKALLPGTQPQTRHQVREGDVLLARKNTPELVGASTYVHETAERLLISDLIFRLVPNPAVIESRYLQAAISARVPRRAIQAMAGGSAVSMSNVSKERLMSLKINVPTLEAQRKFGELSAEIDTLGSRQRQHLSTLDELFASLQHLAFRGERRS